MKEFRFDDVLDTKVSDTDLISGDPSDLKDWDKDSRGEQVGESKVEARYTVKNEDDRFSAPYQEGIAKGGRQYKTSDQVRVFLGDKDITELLTEKCLNRIKEKIDDEVGNG